MQNLYHDQSYSYTELQEFGKEKEDKLDQILDNKYFREVFRRVDNEELGKPQEVKNRISFLRANKSQDEDEGWDFAFYFPKADRWVKVDLFVGSNEDVNYKKVLKEKNKGIMLLKLKPKTIDYAAEGGTEFISDLYDDIEDTFTEYFKYNQGKK